MIAIKKGIELPISGAVVDTTISDSHLNAEPVAVLGVDFHGLRPGMQVAVGDVVKQGDPLLIDKRNNALRLCSPVSGEVVAIHRGERRRLISVVIKPNGAEAKTYAPVAPANLSREEVVERLVDAGFWAFLRARPYDKTPRVEAKPHSIFVNAMDSNPLAFDPLLALAGREAHYQAGLAVLAMLTEGAVNVCHRAGAVLPNTDIATVKNHAFSGKHPAGLVGTHIHFIDPVGENKQVWHIALQELLAIGQLFAEGTLDNQKIIAIAGPSVKKPRLMRVIRGCDVSKLLENELLEGRHRVISGSVFAGRKIENNTEYLGFFDAQISVLPEDNDPIFLEFMRPGKDSFSVTRAYLGRFLRDRKFSFTTAVQGSSRPILPFGIYEEVMPLDILPTPLLKALVIKDTDSAIRLGALELCEEDIALLTYVDAGKSDFGAILRENLDLIEEEG